MDWEEWANAESVTFPVDNRKGKQVVDLNGSYMHETVGFWVGPTFLYGPLKGLKFDALSEFAELTLGEGLEAVSVKVALTEVIRFSDLFEGPVVTPAERSTT